MCLCLPRPDTSVWLPAGVVRDTSLQMVREKHTWFATASSSSTARSVKDERPLLLVVGAMVFESRCTCSDTPSFATF